MCTLETLISKSLSRVVAKQLVLALPEETCEEIINSLSVKNMPDNKVATNQSKNCCKYIITRGDKKGQQCTTRVTGTETYCSKHKKTVNKDTKSRKKSTSKQSEKSKVEELEVVDEELVVTKDDQGRYREPKSGFVFKDEKTIYGKTDGEGNVIPLDRRDLVIVNMHKWVYAPMTQVC